MRLVDPLLLLLGLLFLSALLARGRPNLGYSRPALFGDRAGVPVWARLPGWAMGLGIGLLLVSLARPLGGQVVEQERLRARDIILAIDGSGSMQGTVGSGEGTRIDLAREAALRFVERRQGDRIGLLVFGDETFGSWPLTGDLGVIRDRIRAVGAELGGTDLVKPFEAAVGHFRDLGQSQARVFILLTDGEAPISPERRQALQGALGEMDVHVYLLGVRLRETADVVELVRGAGGRVWNVEEADGFRRTFEEIDRLEPAEVVVERQLVHRELHPWFTLGGLALLAVGIVGTAVAPRVP